MSTVGRAENGALPPVASLEGRVDLREPLADPHRSPPHPGLQEEVRVFVKDDLERQIGRLGVDGDVVDVVAADEVSG